MLVLFLYLLLKEFLFETGAPIKRGKCIKGKKEKLIAIMSSYLFK